MIIIRILFILFLSINFHANSQYLSFSTEYKGDDPFSEREFFLIDVLLYHYNDGMLNI